MRKPKRICRECRWCSPQGASPDEEPGLYDHCLNTKGLDEIPEHVSLVTGETTPKHFKGTYTLCTLQRKEPFLTALIVGYCGRRGRWFEPKDSPAEGDSESQEK